MATDLKIPKQSPISAKGVFPTKIYSITKIYVAFGMMSKRQNFRDGFFMPRNTLMWYQFTPTSRWKLQLHHEVSILVRYTLDLPPPVAVTTRIITFFTRGFRKIPIYYKPSFCNL